ncbi:hypothetical protein N665_0201s0224 [Sinapis alba]|nr:hypothetical protein N665_0201s0224 [Sinapis alba]
MDRISGLSDELLVKILLFVPTKVVVSTSILSKRWEDLWMWLPKLDYGNMRCSESECERLRCFLIRNLPLHRAPVIESFRLRVVCSCFKPENIHMWVLTAVSHCVRELEIVYESDPAMPDMLPSNLFTWKSLVILKLAGDIILDVPQMVSLPSLKTLKLQSMTYFKDETLQRLLSNCPVLEDLVVKLRDYDETGKLSIVIPSLQSLSLYIPDSHRMDGFVIETLNLKYFKLGDHNVELPDINSFIGSITSLKRLTICSETMLDDGFVFNQLEHLDLCLCTTLFPDQLFRLLKASSKLKRLDISLIDGHSPRGMDDRNQRSTVPECMMSSLQTLNWSTYTGEPEERDIAVYILKHALHLKTATIKSSESDFTELEMLKELSRSSRASTTCELVFD